MLNCGNCNTKWQSSFPRVIKYILVYCGPELFRKKFHPKKTSHPCGAKSLWRWKGSSFQRNCPLPRTQANNRKHYVAFTFKINEPLANKSHQPPAFWKNHFSTDQPTKQIYNRPRGNRKTEAREQPNSNEGANAFCHATPPPPISYPKYTLSNCC